MLKGAEKYIGKTMDWKEIERLFPNCYVALDNYNSEGDNVTATLIFVCKKQNEMLSTLREYANRGNKLHTRYTTERNGWGGLCL